MASIIAIVYPNEDTAKQVIEKLRVLSAQYLIELGDAVYVTKTPDGKVHLHQSVDLTASGATYGAFWGMLIGLIFFIPIAGLFMGAIMGAFGGKLTDYGIDDKFVEQMSRELEPGKAAVFVMVNKSTPEKVLPEIAPFGGVVLTSNITPEAEAKLQAALNEGAAAPAAPAPEAPAADASAPAATTE